MISISERLMNRLYDFFIEEEDRIVSIEEKSNYYEIKGKIHYQDVVIRLDKNTLEEVEE